MNGVVANFAPLFLPTATGPPGIISKFKLKSCFAWFIFSIVLSVELASAT